MAKFGIYTGNDIAIIIVLVLLIGGGTLRTNWPILADWYRVNIAARRRALEMYRDYQDQQFNGD